MKAIIISILLYLVASGPAAPGCWVGCHGMCLLSSIAYFICMPPCIALCSATCFSGDSVIEVKNKGLTKVEDLKIGQLVASEKGYTEILVISEMKGQA